MHSWHLLFFARASVLGKSKAAKPVFPTTSRPSIARWEDDYHRSCWRRSCLIIPVYASVHENWAGPDHSTMIHALSAYLICSAYAIRRRGSIVLQAVCLWWRWMKTVDPRASCCKAVPGAPNCSSTVYNFDTSGFHGPVCLNHEARALVARLRNLPVNIAVLETWIEAAL